MSTIQSTDITQAPPAPAGFMNWLLGLFGLLGKSSTPVTTQEIRMTSGSAAETEEGPFVVAPGGYRIRLPQPSDVNSCVGEMLPSVREGLSVLPPLPHVVIDLLREIQDPRSTAASVAGIAASDPALAASLIRMVNAAAMGLSRKISSVSEAVSYLGFGAVKSMVVRLRLDQVLMPKSPQAALDAEDLWIHSLAVSYAADCLSRRVPGIDAGFAATLGLLHDIGKLAVVAQLPGEAEVLQRNANVSALAHEASVLGVDHAGIGADLAARWKLPADLVQAMRFHHRPGEAFHQTDPLPLRQAVHVVHIANQLTKYCYPHADQIEIEPVSDETFALLGLEASLPKLLDEKMRAAIGRAVLFADANTKRPASSPRRFLRLLGGEDAIAVVASASGEPRVSEDNDAIDRLFSTDVPAFEMKDNADAIPTPGAAITHARFIAPATPASVENCVKALRSHQDALDLPNETRSVAALLTRSLLPNLLAVSSADEKIEVAEAVDGRRLTIAVRAPGLATARRLGNATPSHAAVPDAGRRLAEAELANALNLGWFQRIAVNRDGSAVMFEIR